MAIKGSDRQETYAVYALAYARQEASACSNFRLTLAAALGCVHARTHVEMMMPREFAEKMRGMGAEEEPDRALAAAEEDAALTRAGAAEVRRDLEIARAQVRAHQELEEAARRELQQAKEALEQARIRVDDLRGAVGVLRREARDACDELGEGLSAEDAETLRGAGYLFEDGLWTLPSKWLAWSPTCEKGLGFLRRLARDIRAKAPAAAHGEPGKATGGGHAAAGSSSVAEQQGTAQGARPCASFRAVSDGTSVYMETTEVDGTTTRWDVERAPQGLPKPSRVEVGQRWVHEDWITREMVVQVEADCATFEDGTVTASAREMLTSDEWTFLGPAPTPQGPGPRRDEREMAADAADAALEPHGLKVDRAALGLTPKAEAAAGEPTARDAVARIVRERDAARAEAAAEREYSARLKEERDAARDRVIDLEADRDHLLYEAASRGGAHELSTLRSEHQTDRDDESADRAERWAQRRARLDELIGRPGITAFANGYLNGCRDTWGSAEIDMMRGTRVAPAPEPQPSGSRVELKIGNLYFAGHVASEADKAHVTEYLTRGLQQAIADGRHDAGEVQMLHNGDNSVRIEMPRSADSRTVLATVAELLGLADEETSEMQRLRERDGAWCAATGVAHPELFADARAALVARVEAAGIAEGERRGAVQIPDAMRRTHDDGIVEGGLRAKAKAEELAARWTADRAVSLRRRNAVEPTSVTWARRDSSAAIRRSCILSLCDVFEIDAPPDVQPPTGGEPETDERAAAHDAAPAPHVDRAALLALAEEWEARASQLSQGAFDTPAGSPAGLLDDGEARGLRIAALALKSALDDPRGPGGGERKPDAEKATAAAETGDDRGTPSTHGGRAVESVPHDAADVNATEQREPGSWDRASIGGVSVPPQPASRCGWWAMAPRRRALLAGWIGQTRPVAPARPADRFAAFEALTGRDGWWRGQPEEHRRAYVAWLEAQRPTIYGEEFGDAIVGAACDLLRGRTPDGDVPPGPGERRASVAPEQHEAAHGSTERVEVSDAADPAPPVKSVSPIPPMGDGAPDREALGREVHEVWAYATRCGESPHEVDRRIGERLFAMGERHAQRAAAAEVASLRSLHEAERATVRGALEWLLAQPGEGLWLAAEHVRRERDELGRTLDMLAELAQGLGSLDVEVQGARAAAVIDRFRSDRQRIDDAWREARAEVGTELSDALAELDLCWQALDPDLQSRCGGKLRLAVRELVDRAAPRLVPVAPGPLQALADRIAGHMVDVFSQPADGELRAPAAAVRVLQMVDEYLRSAAPRGVDAPNLPASADRDRPWRGLKHEAQAHAWSADEWVAEAIDMADEGVIYAAHFSGPSAMERACEYAAWASAPDAAPPAERCEAVMLMAQQDARNNGPWCAAHGARFSWESDGQVPRRAEADELGPVEAARASTVRVPVLPEDQEPAPAQADVAPAGESEVTVGSADGDVDRVTSHLSPTCGHRGEPVRDRTCVSCRMLATAQAQESSPEPVEEADERWQPGAVWEFRGVRQYVLTEVDVSAVRFSGHLPIERAEMTEVNGWRYVGPAAPAAPKPGPHIERRNGREVTVGSPSVVNDCNERGPAHGSCCTIHIDGQHVSEGDHLARGSWRVVERWPISSAQQKEGVK